MQPLATASTNETPQTNSDLLRHTHRYSRKDRS